MTLEGTQKRTDLREWRGKENEGNRIRKSGNTTRHLTPRKRSNTFQICDRIYKSGNRRESETRDGGAGQAFQLRNHQEPSPQENPPQRERTEAVPMQIDTAQKRRRSTETTENANKKDGKGNEVTKQPTHYTETDAERATRLATEMIARYFPETEQGVTVKPLKNAWPETAAAAKAAADQDQENKKQIPRKTMTQIRPNHPKKTNYENSKHSLRWR